MIPMSFADLLNDSSVSLLAGALDGGLRPLVPYSDEACAFLDSLSKRLLADRQARAYPDVVSLAYWCRRSSLQAKRIEFERREGGRVRLGRGLALHIAPSNVPVNFAFSFVFSLLAGNANVVRVPTKQFGQVDVICRAISEELASHPNLANQNAFVRYPSNKNEITEMLSERADIRMIWGGDATVERIRAMKSAPRCVDIAFSDRYSVAVINACEIRSLDEKSLEQLARAFYNDTYLMDQNACSSPMIVFWLNDSRRARLTFWDAVARYAHNVYGLQPAISVEKYVKLSEDAAGGLVGDLCAKYDGYLTHVDVTKHIHDNPEGSLESLRGRGGYFYEAAIDSIDGLLPLVTSKYQTLSYYGINPADVAQSIATQGVVGFDRIVPIGKALDIDIVWDGHDLAAELSRIISQV